MLVKGSLGSRMARVVDGADCARRPGGDEEGCLMLYSLLVPLADHIGVFNCLRYITFRTGGAVMTALLVSFVLGPGADPLAASEAARGPADPARTARRATS